MANKMLNLCNVWCTKTLLLLFCICSINVLAQREQLIREGLFLDAHNEYIDAISLANQKIIFSAFDEDTHNPSGNSSLWITGGPENNTKMLKNFGKEPDIDFFNNITLSERFFNFNNKIFFNAGSHLDDRINYLYITDGTENGTFRLIDSKVAKSIYAVLNGEIYISNSTELLTSDGTKAGTKKLSISSMSEISNLFTINQHLIIETESAVYSYHDQTQALTFLADKTNPVVATKDYIFFVGKDGDLWKSNGTTQGTTAVINIADGADVRVPKGLMATNKYVAFLSYTDKTKNNTCLWVSDGVTTAPMKDDKGKIVSTDTTGFRPIPTKFDEKIYFQLFNLDDVTLASNNYLYVFHNEIAKAIFLENITGFEGNLYPFKPKVNNKQEYLYGTPEDRFILDGDITIKGFNATTLGRIAQKRILTDTPTSWIKSGNKIYYNKSKNVIASGLYVQSACGFDFSIERPDGSHIGCGKEFIRLNAVISVFNEPQAVYYAWFDNDRSQHANLKAYNPGVYIAHAIDGLCTLTDSITVTKSDSLAVSITGNNSFCSGQNTKLMAISSGVAPYTYQWKNDINTIGSNTNTFTANTAGNYSVIVKDSTGCQGTAPVFFVKQQLLPDVSITKSAGTDIVSGGSTILSVIPSANQTYQWSKNATAISGATSSTYIAKEAGKYSVTVNANGCSTNSEIVIVNLVLANESIIEPILIEVFPNPTDNLIKLRIADPMRKAAQISLFNTQGIIVKSWEMKQYEATLNLSDLPAGQYILKADINNQSTSKKIIKLH